MAKLNKMSANSLAGEITGNGKSLKNDDGTLNGKSACAFSGREDDPSDPLFRGDIAQSWGQIIKAIRDTFPAFLHPGVACNPQRSQCDEDGVAMQAILLATRQWMTMPPRRPRTRTRHIQ